MIAGTRPMPVLDPMRFRFPMWRAVAACAWLAFALPATAAIVELTTLHTFTGADGAGPTAGLVPGPDGRLWGTTFGGGAAGMGTVYRIGTDGTFALMHSFAGGTGGASPRAKLALGQDGNLYGTTERTPGVTGGQGTIFRITPAGAFATLHVFQMGRPVDSVQPGPVVQASDGQFYGVTQLSTTDEWGAVYRMDAGGNVSLLHNFLRDGTDGGFPKGALVEGLDGNLYGTTSVGTGSNGPPSSGSVYRITPAGALTTIDNFSTDYFSSGSTPVAGLVQADDGNFYGSTMQGGVGSSGVLFRITPAGVRTTLHAFTGSDGGQIESELIQAADGRLYGTSTWRGLNYGGTLYSMKLDGSDFLVLRRFEQTYTRPNGLVQGPDGAIYGTTQSGGGSGTVFRLRLLPGVPTASFESGAQTATTGNRKGEATTFVRVVLSAPSTLPVEIPYTVINDSPQLRYTVNPAKLVIPAGDASASFVVRAAFNGPRASGEAVDCDATLTIAFASPIVNGTAGAIASSTLRVHNDATAAQTNCR